jgi:GntR family transcriptional repressor for pyruvate dehydrogenase complex
MSVLIRDITSGALAAGEPLPREADLASKHAVSRGVARECYRGLEERGLVRVKHGRGATVLPSDQWDMFDPEVLTALLEHGDSARVLQEYLECRYILEIEAAAMAAERATPDDLQILSDAFDRMTATAEQARANPAAEALYQEADIAFHRAVIVATENRALARMTEPIHRGLATAVRQLARPEERFQRGLPEHERILFAIMRGEPDEARSAMRDHLMTVEGYLRDFRREAVAAVSVAAEGDDAAPRAG